MDIEGNVTACNRDVLQNTVIANIYTDNILDTLKKLEHSIDKISKGDSDFNYCRYCKGSTTKRGKVIRSLTDRFK